MTRKTLLCLLVVATAASCSSDQHSKLSDADQAQIESEVRAAMESYTSAIRALDVEGVIAHYANDPKFSVASDAVLTDYETWVSGVRQTFEGLRRFDVRWESIDVTVLEPGVALAYAPYSGTMVDTTGTEMSHNGVVTWVWMRGDSDWRMIHGHAVSEHADSN